MLKIYYWPMLARGASLVRMLEHTGTPYEYVSDRASISAVASCMGAAADVFAPPIVVDGDYTLSQSVACCIYIGNKVGLNPKCQAFDSFKATQYLVDVIDAFEDRRGFGGNNEHGPTLKKFLEGERWANLMGNIERSIKGPYYFGDEPSCCDFFLLQALDWREPTFEKLKAKLGVDPMAPFPKAVAVAAALRASPGYVNYKGGLKMMSAVKDEIVDSYND